MTSKLQRKIRAVSKTAASAAVEGALDAILYKEKKKEKKGQFVVLFGDARMRIRIRDVQTMPGLEGRRGAAAAAGGGREMGDGERISLLVVILFFCCAIKN